MVNASDLLGLGSGGGGSVEITSTVATGSTLTSGEGVSLNASGEFVEFDGTAELIGIATADAIAGATATVTTTEALAGTVIEVAAAADLDATFNEADVSTLVNDVGNSSSTLYDITNNTELNSDGTVAYYVNNTQVSKRTLTTAFDISAAGPATAFDTGLTFRGLSVNKDETKFYYRGSGTALNEYTIPGGDLTAATLSGSLLVSSNDRGVYITRSGQYLLVGDNGDSLKLFEMSTPSDINTATEVSSTTITGIDILSCQIGESGKKVYILDDTGTNTVREYDLTTAFDLTTLNTTPVNTFVATSDEHFWISEDSTRAIAGTTADSRVLNITAQTVTVPTSAGDFLYVLDSGAVTSSVTDNFLGFKISDTKLILTKEPN